MKTWEMIKALTNNPKLKFNLKHWNCEAYKGATLDLNIETLEQTEWEVIPQEITVQKALEIIINAGEVTFKVDNFTGKVNKGIVGTFNIMVYDTNNKYLVKYKDKLEIFTMAVTRGKWFESYNI